MPTLSVKTSLNYQFVLNIPHITYNVTPCWKLQWVKLW